MAQEVESKAFAAKKRRDTIAAWEENCTKTAAEINNAAIQKFREQNATYENLLLNKIECLESALMEIAKQKTHKETCEEGGFMFEAECQSRADKEKDKAIVFFRNIARKCFPDKEWK